MAPLILAAAIVAAPADRERRLDRWAPLIEKAYAKMHHSYAAIEGGLVNIALVDLTGGSAESMYDPIAFLYLR